MNDIVGRLRADLASGLSASIGDTREAAAEIERLREALAPFARNADAWIEFGDDQELVEPFDGYEGVSDLKVRHLRVARAALNPSRDES